MLAKLLLELWVLIAPIRRALASGSGLALFLERFGYRLDPAVWDTAVADLASLKTAIDDFAAAIRAIPDLTNMSEAEQAELAAAAVGVFNRLRTIGTAGGQIAALNIGPDLFDDLFDAFLHDYLSRRAPFLLQAFVAIEALVYEEILPTAPRGRQIVYVRTRFDWDRLGQFISDTGEWAEQVYGWGADFQATKALLRLARLMNMVGPRSYFEAIPPATVSAFLRNLPPPPHPNAPPGGGLSQVRMPFFDIPGPTEPDGFTPIIGDAGLLALPYGDFNRTDQMGLSLAPYARGQIDGVRALTPDIDLSIIASAFAAGGAVLVIQPGGLHVEGTGAANLSFDFGVRYGHDNHAEIILFGEAGATRLSVESLSATVGGAIDGDLFAAIGAEKLRLVLDLSEDGFLGVLLPNPIEVSAGDLLMGWRAGRGVYFEGGTSLAVIIPLNLSFGPVNLYEVGLELDWSADFKFIFSISGDARLGPLFASVEALGLVITLVRSQNGVLGKYDLAFGIKPPTGYAIALESNVITGGGRLDFYEHEYRGALALKLASFSISAFAILTTQMPDGSDGFSFVASIFGEFTLPLGYNFYLTGVGGIVGLNRTTDTDALRAVLFAGRFDNLLFPKDPIANAATILDDMAAIFPVREGQHLFGPVAKIAWGQPVMIEGKLGLVLELGANFRLLILGGLALALPIKDAALISLTLSFFGEIDFAAGKISFDASLESSRILTWPVSGDSAFRTGWGAGITHVAAFGGLHPSYPRPDNLPELRRLGINFGTNNPRVTIEAYAAVTLNSLQFGGRADLYAKGPDIFLVGQTAAEGWIYLNALVYFNPFSFDAELGGGLQLLVDGDVVAGLGFELRLSGPNPFHIRGKVWVTVFGIDVDFPIRYKWGEQQQLPESLADPVEALHQALQTVVLEPLTIAARFQAVTMRSDDSAAGAVDPVGGARLVQRALPLGVTIERVGEAQIAGDVRRLDLRVFEPGGAAVSPSDARLEFVRGHFWSQTESDRLRAPTFVSHKAGFEIAGSGLVVNTFAAVNSIYSYEIISIGGQDDRRPADLFGSITLADASVVHWVNAFYRDTAEPPERYGGYPQPIAAPAVDTAGFSVGSASAGGGSQPSGLSLSEALLAARARASGSKMPSANPVVADYIAAVG